MHHVEWFNDEDDVEIEESATGVPSAVNMHVHMYIP